MLSHRRERLQGFAQGWYTRGSAVVLHQERDVELGAAARQGRTTVHFNDDLRFNRCMYVVFHLYQEIKQLS